MDSAWGTDSDLALAARRVRVNQIAVLMDVGLVLAHQNKRRDVNLALTEGVSSAFVSCNFSDIFRRDLHVYTFSFLYNMTKHHDCYVNVTTLKATTNG